MSKTSLGKKSRTSECPLISVNFSQFVKTVAEVVSKELVNFREAPGVRKQFGSARENMGQQCEFRNFIELHMKTTLRYWKIDQSIPYIEIII